MYPVSDDYRTVVRKSHNVSVVADVYRAGALIVEAIPIIGGFVSVDETAATRRHASLTLADKTGTLIPSEPTDTLAPYGNEVKIFRGVDGEMIPLGVFRFESTDVTHLSGISIQIEAFDRSSVIADARFEEPYVIADGTNFGTAIQTIAELSYPGLTFSFASTDNTTPLLVFEEGADPWDEMRKMAESIGMEVFFDPNGVLVLRYVPDPSVLETDAKYIVGENTAPIDVKNALRTRPGYNRFIVTGEAVDDVPPVRAMATDFNPDSPTYYGGPYGKRPRFYSSPFIKTLQQAQDAADGLLLRELGGTEQLGISVIPNPAHDAGDVVHVVDTSLGLDELAVVTSLSIPLESNAEGPMPIGTKARRQNLTETGSVWFPFS